MRRELEAVVHELKRLRREGETEYYVRESTMEALRGAVQRIRKAAPVVIKDPVESRPEEAPKQSVQVIEKKAEVPPLPDFKLPSGTKQEKYKFLQDLVLSDEYCQSQLKSGKKIVFGIGDLDAKIFFCGEAPGEEEEIEGAPFVGRAGQLLNRIIQAMGLSRDTVYISNIMNFRPPMPTPHGNRPPTAEEMAYCLPYLRAQLEIVKPEVIVALGKTAVDGLLGPDKDRKIGKVRGHWFTYDDVALIPTYHPSYLLRNSSSRVKRLVWEDMLSVMEKIGMIISEKQRGYFKS